MFSSRSVSEDEAPTKHEKTTSPGKAATYEPSWPGSRTLDAAQRAATYVLQLDEENSVIRVPNFLSREELATYTTAMTGNVTREQGKAGFGHMKPRYEVCYSTDGAAYVYSRKAQPTTTYPPHVRALVPRILASAKRFVPSTPFTRLSTGVDIEYAASLPQGGSIGEHSDDEQPWGMVAVLSLGQCRYFRIRRKTKGDHKHRNLCHLPTDHNSLLIMHGPSFQARYTHEVPKLPPTVTPETRWSLNMRFLAEPAAAETAPTKREREEDEDEMSESPNKRRDLVDVTADEQH